MRTVALSISHAPWIAARTDSMRALREALHLPSPAGGAPPEGVLYHEERERAPNWHWAMSQWVWAAEQAADDFVATNDDVVVFDMFWPALQALMTVYPDDILDLSCVHPAGKRLAREGRRAYTTTDGLVGLGYRLPLPVLKEFLAWRRDALHHDAIEWITEDSLLNIFALCTKRRIVHPVPTILDHSEEIRSTYGNDEHAYRSPSVTWKDSDVCGWSDDDLVRADFWQEPGDRPPVALGRMYGKTHWAAKKLVKGFTPEMLRAAERARCPQPYARFFTRA